MLMLVLIALDDPLVYFLISYADVTVLNLHLPFGMDTGLMMMMCVPFNLATLQTIVWVVNVLCDVAEVGVAVVGDAVATAVVVAACTVVLALLVLLLVEVLLLFLCHLLTYAKGISICIS